MDIKLYRQYLQEVVEQAFAQSDGSIKNVSEYLHAKKIGGMFVRHKEERIRALEDARRAFDEHRHWPLSIILSHLGVEMPEVKGGSR